MKPTSFLTFFFLLVQLIAAASFSAVDQEIFQINHELKQDLGEDFDFYQWLKLPKKSKSSYDEITKAYKKLSIKLHPDKFHQKNKNKLSSKLLKKAEKLNNERYQRLSVIGEILRTDRKERYDFYLANGFPKWNGQGFFYSKFKPGFFLTVAIVFIIVSVLHYILLSLQRKQERKRVEVLKEELKKAAWPNGYPPADFSDRKVTSPALDRVFLVKSDGNIFLVEQDEDRNDIGFHLVDAADIKDVTLRDSFFYRLPVWGWNSTAGKIIPSLYVDNTAINTESHKDIAPEVAEPKKKKKVNGDKKELPNGKIVYGANKAGGRRRK